MLADKLLCKTMLTVNTITVKVANKSWSKTGACTYQDTSDDYGNVHALRCLKELC